jgi:predicted dehydrogenase
VESGEMGDVLWMRGVYGKAGGIGFAKGWRSDRETAGGGILLDQGIHMLDLFRYFCGDFGEVKSMVATSFWPIGVEDNAFALLRNHRGQIAMIHSSATQWRHTFLLETCLAGGLVTVSGILSSTRSYGFAERLIIARREFEDRATAFGNPRETITSFDRDRSWEREMEEFGRCILDGTPPVHGTTEDALKVMELVDRIYRGDPVRSGKNPR